MKKECKVMVVDDVYVFRHTLKRNLAELGHIILSECDNGFDAVEMYKVRKPDFVTLDITMPSVDGVNGGLDALEAIIKFDKDAKVIMITSHSEHKTIVEAISKGAKGYIRKPITKDKLASSISKIFPND